MSAPLISGPILEKDVIEFLYLSSGTPTGSLSGTLDGTNATFTLTEQPTSNASVQVFKNGLCLCPTSTDYNISGKVITFGTAPGTSATLLVKYRAMFYSSSQG